MVAKILGSEGGRDDDHLFHLPLELIMENIFARVSIRDVMNCTCVCKLWYEKINKDPHFASAYLEKSQKDASFFFYLFNIVDDDLPPKSPLINHIFSVDDEGESIKLLYFNKKLAIDCKGKFELVGHCNGLICISQSFSKTKGAILIINPSRNHKLFITRPIIDGYMIICYGLGFDSLTHEYKVVLIARSTTTTRKGINNNNELLLFKCLVFTLGKNSWRETTTSATIPHLLGGVGKTTTTSFYKSSIYSGGALFWRTRSSSSAAAAVAAAAAAAAAASAAAANMNNDMLLLSFDLHDDKFQVIPLPAECASSNSSMLEQQHQIVDPLLEFKGYPCVARLEKTISSGEGSCRITSNRTKFSIYGGGSCCCSSYRGKCSYGGSCSKTSSSCSTTNTSFCFKVHLHILKDKVLKLWIKETFDVLPFPCAIPTFSAIPCFLESSHITPPFRIMSLSDQVLLYCFDGQCTQLYDLQTKRLKRASGCYRQFDIFTKKESSAPPLKFHDDDNNNLYEQMDYHLSSHVKNILSLQALIPKGARRVDIADVESILDDPESTFVGYLCITGSPKVDFF